MARMTNKKRAQTNKELNDSIDKLIKGKISDLNKDENE